MPQSGHRVLQIAVAGAGLIGRRHIELVQASPRCRLSALVDPAPSSQELAAGLGVPRFADLEELFASGTEAGPDGVIVATPNPLHVPGALLCAQHGVPALIEKPVADSLAAGRVLAEAMERLRTPMLVGHHRRHSSTLQAARQAVQSGGLGRIVTIMGSAQFYKPASYFEQGPWRTREGGGPILINLIHEIDDLRFLCGEIDSVYAVASNAVRRLAVEDTAVMTLKFASGVLGTFTLSDTAAATRSWEHTSGENAEYPYQPSEDCYFIAGTHGSLAVPTMRTWSYAEGAERSWHTPFTESRLSVDAVDPLAAQLAHFCDLIEGRAEPIISVPDALQSLRTVQAIRQSIATGLAVSVHSVA